MVFVRLGHSGLQVSRLALGCMSYGDPGWRPWVQDERAARPFFVRAIEAGINFFDTADMYSLGISEQITGRLRAGAARRGGHRHEGPFPDGSIRGAQHGRSVAQTHRAGR
jgi:aryl-alcohol dehydrogenase-like predicted oxidoreductase